MLPRQEGTRYTVQGRVYCGGASGKRILLSGIRVLTAVQVQSILTERLDLVIVDSYLFSFQGTQNQPLLRVELYRDSIGQASWSLGSCAIIGCRFLESNGGVLQAISIQNTSLPETNDIIGNIFQGIGDIMCAIDITNANRPFHIENNLVIGPLHFLRLTGADSTHPCPCRPSSTTPSLTQGMMALACSWRLGISTMLCWSRTMRASVRALSQP
jgi:hypothetical protein